MPCYFLPELNSNINEYKITGDEHHHIYRVLRKNCGDIIKLSSGSGILAEGEITSIDSKSVFVKIVKSELIEQTKPYLGLAFSLLKNKHDNMIVEKCTELGCRDFFPITTDFTIRKSGKNIIEKFRKTAVSAIKQCDNAWLPAIHECNTLPGVIEQIRVQGYEPIVALESEFNNHISQRNDIYKFKGIALIIGPEGGFSEEEKKLFLTSDIYTFSLGNHILRAETAAIAGISTLASIFRACNKNYY